uniref:RRM domain-containing protein n=1 Tax=Caenorhabditis tropicalis TaxID=1561998 RepID=A0A1I7T3V0_9PELO
MRERKGYLNLIDLPTLIFFLKSKTLINQSASPFEVTIEIVENGSRKHRGFAFVQCRSPAEASLLLTKFTGLFTKVNYAKREPKPAENVMSNITNVFVRGISREMPDTDLYQAFGGVADGVVQCHVADGYGFVLFDTRANAQKKILEMDGKVLNGKTISVNWARPDTVGRKRKRPMGEESPSDFSNLSSLLKRPVIPSQMIQIPPPTTVFQPSLLPLFNPSFPLLFPQNPLLTQTDLSQYLNFLIIATTKLDILKADDFRPMKRGRHNWGDDDQKMIKGLKKKTSKPGKGVFQMVKDSYQRWTRPNSTEKPSRQDKNEKDEGKKTRKGKEVLKPADKNIAVKWELPSAEYYPIRYEEHIRRNLNIRKSCGELQTAQEAPAVREKGEANDRTDQDCLTIPHDLHSSKESLATEGSIQSEKSTEKKSEPMEEPKPVEEVKKVEEEPKKEEKKEPEEPPKVEEKKEEVKVVEEKKEIVPEKKPKKKTPVNVKRHPDSGELIILGEKNGIVTFTCSTRHRVKKSSKKSEK